MFDGQCRAAFTRYHQLLGGDLRMLSFGDSPMAAEVESKWHDRIVHVTLQVGDFELAGADVLPQDYATPQGFSVLLSFEDSERGERVFNELAIGGEIRFPFQPTFWSSGFGVLVDEFGVPWEVSCSQTRAAA
jgi:PhnB protein